MPAKKASHIAGQQANVAEVSTTGKPSSAQTSSKPAKQPAKPAQKRATTAKTKAPAKPKGVTSSAPDAESPRQKHAGGRPTIYTEELATEICAMIAEGKSLRTIGATDGMPSIVSVYTWMRKYPEFLKRYEQAKQDQADALAEEMLDIADDGTNDWMETHDKDGMAVGYKVNGEHVQRSRLRIDTRKWIAERMKPKKYGAKVGVEHDVSDPLKELLLGTGGALAVKQTTDDSEDD